MSRTNHGAEIPPVVPDTRNKMLYVADSKESFRCEGCGSNVFKRVQNVNKEQYRCNGCGETYTVL